MQPGLVLESTSLGGTWGVGPTGVSGKKRDERKGGRPESECLLIMEPSTGRFTSEAASARDGKLGHVGTKTFLIGPETSSREKEGFTRPGEPSPGNVSAERLHDIQGVRPVGDRETRAKRVSRRFDCLKYSSEA